MRDGGRGQRRLLTLVAATGGALWIAAGPASAVTISIPTVTIPPLPVTVPADVVVPPLQVTVTVPGSSSGVNVQLPGVSVTTPTTPALSTVTLPTGIGPISTPAPIEVPLTATPATGAPSSPSASPGSGAQPGASPGSAVAPPSDSPAAERAAARNSEPRLAPLSAVIKAPAPSSFLSTIPTIATRLLLWCALAAAALAMQMFVSSALADRRRRVSEAPRAS